jgi:hypothetical protein
MKPVSITLTGHLNEDALRHELSSVQSLLGVARRVLIVDARQMTGYDAAARSLFVDWNARFRDRILGVAIVTTKPLWRMVIRAMSLASKQIMIPFSSLQEAQSWAVQEPTKDRRNIV